MGIGRCGDREVWGCQQVLDLELSTSPPSPETSAPSRSFLLHHFDNLHDLHHLHHLPLRRLRCHAESAARKPGRGNGVWGATTEERERERKGAALHDDCRPQNGHKCTCAHRRATSDKATGGICTCHWASWAWGLHELHRTPPPNDLCHLLTLDLLARYAVFRGGGLTQHFSRSGRLHPLSDDHRNQTFWAWGMRATIAKGGGIRWPLKFKIKAPKEG